MKLIHYILILFFFLINGLLYAQLDLDFETDRGFYDTPFQLELTVNDPGAFIRYTTNGTAPTTTTGSLYTAPITISTTSNIRAIAYTGTDTTKVLTHTYIFLDDVVNQPNSIIGYPTSGFEFDASIKNDPTYSTQLRDALTQVGTISIVMDLIQLDSVHNVTFGNWPSKYGIEAPASVELLYPNGESHQENCGFERFGGSSFDNPKRNFRLSFKSIYGEPKLEYPIFGKEVNNNFDQIALRAGHAGCINREGTSLHTGESNDLADQVVRDLQIDIQPDDVGVAGNFMHLYINGIYWGVYNATERPVAGWAKKYYGGSKDDWDVIKTKAALAGDTTVWSTLNNIANNQDLSIPANYDLIQDYIDIEQFIDYVIITNYAPHSDNYVSGKNSYLNMNRNDNTGFKFWIWDTEPALDYYWTLGWTKDHVGHSAYNNIFNALRNNSDFLTKVGDQMQCHCFNDGALTPNNTIDAYMDVYNSTDIAMIAEAARWATSSAYQGLVDAKNRITNSYMPVRTNETITNYRNAGLYPNIDAVQFSQYGGTVASGYQLSLSNPNGAGTIYYTTDGTDPRASGGGISGSAQTYSGNISLPDGVTEIKARIKSGSTWSAMCPRRFYTNVDYSGLVINEIMYHADDTCSLLFDELDYIEIHNKGTKNINLADTKFSCGINYKFDINAQIAPGDYLVLAENADTFNLHYGFMPHGEYNGGLSNDGETLLYQDFAENIIDSLTYNDKNPWDEAPDGKGPSLELRDPTLDNSDPLNWFRSDNLCGSPGQQNGRLCTNAATPIVINEINYNPVTLPNTGDWVELYNPNASAVDISNWEFYDNENKYVVPAGTTLQPDEYLILAEDVALFATAFPHLNASQYIGNLGFNLSNGGERVSLFDNNKCLSDYVVYNDKFPWDTIPDGNGPSLSLVAPNSDNTLPQSWEASSNINSAYGTPGRENTPCPELSLEISPLLCAGFPTTLNVDSVYNNMTFNWFTSGASPTNATTDSTALVWNNSGTYNVQLLTNYFECPKSYLASVTVEDCNTIPNILDDNFATNEDNLLSDNVLTNDNDPDNDNLTVNTTPQTNVTNGTLMLNPDGTFDYTPNPDFFGTDSFTYEVCDDAVFASAVPRSFIREVTSGADDVEELSTDGSIDTDSGDLDLLEDSPKIYTAVGIRMTDINIPQNITVTSAYLEFVADEAQSVATSITMTGEAVGDALPIAATPYSVTSKPRTNASASWANIPAWTTGNTYQSTDISGIVQELINRGDWASGNAMTFILEGTGTRTAESFEGTVAPKLVINYDVNLSDVSLCDTAVVNIIVAPINDTPQATDDNITTSEEVAKTGNAIINDNDTDGDNLSLNISPITAPQNGSLIILAGGSYSYTPNMDFYGTDTFEYQVCDDGNPILCDTASVTIDVTPINDAPIPAPDTLYMIANSTIQDNILLNDSDIENDNLTAIIIPMAVPANGSVTIQPNGNIDYTPNPNYVGTDSFTYEVCDDGSPSMCNTETVLIIIEPDCVDIQLYAWLEGTFDPALGEMTTRLSAVRKLLPGQTPTSNLATPTPAGQPYSIAPWNYAGTEGAGWTDADYTGNETDWVLVSFRTGTAKNTEVGMTAGLLMKDGSIAFPDRCALTSTVASPLYIVVEHRNHIGIMTPVAIPILNNELSYDFRISDSYRDQTSFGQKQLPTGEWCLFAGDADQSDFPSFDIQGTDKTLWFDNNGIFDYYFSPDFNLDGDINGQDKSLWFENNGISSRVPK